MGLVQYVRGNSRMRSALVWIDTFLSLPQLGNRGMNPLGWRPSCCRPFLILLPQRPWLIACPASCGKLSFLLLTGRPSPFLNKGRRTTTTYNWRHTAPPTSSSSPVGSGRVSMIRWAAATAIQNTSAWLYAKHLLSRHLLLFHRTLCPMPTAPRVHISPHSRK